MVYNHIIRFSEEKTARTFIYKGYAPIIGRTNYRCRCDCQRLSQTSSRQLRPWDRVAVQVQSRGQGLQDLDAARARVDIELIATTANISAQVSFRYLSLDRDGMVDRDASGAAFCIQPERRIVR